MQICGLCGIVNPISLEKCDVCGSSFADVEDSHPNKPASQGSRDKSPAKRVSDAPTNDSSVEDTLAMFDAQLQRLGQQGYNQPAAHEEEKLRRCECVLTVLQ